MSAFQGYTMKRSRGHPRFTGNWIGGEVVKEGDCSPQVKIFLVFDDDTRYEFYGNYTTHDIGGVSLGSFEHVRQYVL